MEAPLQTGLLELLVILQNLSAAQLSGFLSFVRHGAPRIDLIALTALCRQLNSEQLERLAASALQDQPLERVAAELQIQNLSFEIYKSFASILRLLQLHELLFNLSEMQLMKIIEMIPQQYDQVMQLQLLQQLQEFLDQLLPQTLQQLQRQLEEVEPGQEKEHLIQLLELRPELFHLCQPIMVMLQLEWDELQKLQQFLPKLQPGQLMQLLQLLKLSVYDVLQMRECLMSHHPQPHADLAAELGVDGHRPTLTIIEQPPERQVYKRNLKPNPVVRFNGADGDIDGSMYIAPVLVRCDNLDEQPKLMTGNAPVKLTASKVVTFRKLKVTSTSHQQGETLFCIKFELRRYHGDSYDVLSFIQSNPICILSHSTQLKPSASSTIVPVVGEVIPVSGSTTGGTRVAVLGTNFVDNPALRVRFDTIDVLPVFHGPGTLIVQTPQHAPGTVPVRVSNDNRRWSDTVGTFTFHDAQAPTEGQPVPAFSMNLNALGIDAALVGAGLSEAAWSGSFDSIKLLGDRHGGSALHHAMHLHDSRGFAPLHYAAASGHVHVVQWLVASGTPVDFPDQFGSTALYWAVACGHTAVAEQLLSAGASPFAPNIAGETPLLRTICDSTELLPRFLRTLRGNLNAPALADGMTALHLAAAVGSLSSLQLLLQYGAHINVQDEEGETALFYAVREGQLEAAALLLRSGINVALANSDGETALHLAALLGNVSMLHLLVGAGAALNRADLTGATPLHAAVDARQHASTECLLRAGADCSLYDRSGMTPLHVAALRGCLSTFRQLISIGADLSAVTFEGESVYDMSPTKSFAKATVQQNAAHLPTPSRLVVGF